MIISNYWNSALRSLTKKKGFSAINIIGLAIGAGMYGIGVAATVLTLMGLELLSYIFKSLGMKSSMIIFSTNEKDIIKKVTRVLNDKGYLLVSYQMEKVSHSNVDTFIVTLVIKARKSTDDNQLLLFMEEFPEVTVERIE